MDKLESTKDATERKRLLAEHRQLMKKQMEAMKGESLIPRMAGQHAQYLAS